MTIKVPFALLNLTLTAPLVDNPTQYFPCKSYTPSGPNFQPSNEYHLGRAFLQAAFIGMNWNQDMWWMAQAPGPSRLAQYMTQIQNSTTTIESSGDSSTWVNSWSDILTPLTAAGGNLTNNGTSLVAKDGEKHDSGLSTGAKAGIGAGLCGLLLLGGAIFFMFQKWQKQNRRAGTVLRNQWDGHELDSKTTDPGKQLVNSTSVPQGQISELPGKQTNEIGPSPLLHSEPTA